MRRSLAISATVLGLNDAYIIRLFFSHLLLQFVLLSYVTKYVFVRTGMGAGETRNAPSYQAPLGQIYKEWGRVL